MAFDRIVKFDPWLLGAIQKAMGKLPAIPGDLAKVKSLTFSDGERFSGEKGLLLNGWIELVSGDFSAIGNMPNLHTLLFKNHRTLKIGNFDFLCQCQRLKKLDLSGTDFSDCELLTRLPNLQYVMLTDRRQLVHTQVLEHMHAQAETELEKNERSRAKCFIDTAAEEKRKICVADTYTADSRLICWLAVSLGKLPATPNDLAKVRLLDSRKRIPSLDNLTGKLPPWLTIKEGDFSLIGKLPDLQALLLWGIILDDFSFLSECRELVYLNLTDTNFTNCSLLMVLPNLRYICLPERAQLEDFSLLEKRQAAHQQETRQKLERFLYDETSDKLSEVEQALVSPPVFHIECDGDSPWKTVPERKDCTISSEVADQLPQTETIELFYGEEHFDDLIIVRGEDVIISYEGESRVRHVEAEFCMDCTPVLWEVFSRVRDEGDNWAKLSSQKTRQLTDELMKAIINGDVDTIYISLEPWEEGHIFDLTFAGGWVDITYMDDDTPVYYHSYNPVYADMAESSPIEFDGHPPIPKAMALEDMRLVADIVRHFLATGQLLPGTYWKRGKNP